MSRERELLRQALEFIERQPMDDNDHKLEKDIRAYLAVEPEPKEWQSLTDEEITILSLVNRNAHGALTVPEFARGVEQALKEKNR